MKKLLFLLLVAALVIAGTGRSPAIMSMMTPAGSTNITRITISCGTMVTAAIGTKRQRRKDFYQQLIPFEVKCGAEEGPHRSGGSVSGARNAGCADPARVVW